MYQNKLWRNKKTTFRYRIIRMWTSREKRSLYVGEISISKSVLSAATSKKGKRKGEKRFSSRELRADQNGPDVQNVRPGTSH